MFTPIIKYMVFQGYSYAFYSSRSCSFKASHKKNQEFQFLTILQTDTLLAMMRIPIRTDTCYSSNVTFISVDVQIEAHK